MAVMTESLDPDLPPDDEALARALQRSRLLHDAPDALIERAIALFDTRATAQVAAPVAPGGPASALRRLVAALTFDSAGAAPLAFGRRGRGQPVRQLLYSVEGRDIDLRLMPAPPPAGARWRLAGQVLGPDRQGRVELVQGDLRREAAWDELGEFAFDDLGPEACTLRLEGEDWSTELPAVEPGAPGA
jgi:hypothetical protein